MTVDVSRFHLLNVTDTCSIWNILSSRVLYGAAQVANCSFCCTTFVLYECLYKRRSTEVESDRELKARMKKEHDDNRIMACDLDVADLQGVEILENRRKLSKGELSSIVFAKKTQQAFMTDDQKARKLAQTELAADRVQTTPHLLGWLLFERRITDGDKDEIIKQHKELDRPLAIRLRWLQIGTSLGGVGTQQAGRCRDAPCLFT